MAANIGQQFAKSYNSFSGVDIKVVFSNQVIAELQAISYSVNREKAPLYTMGQVEPRSFSRGKRGIAGTIVFLMFDRHALIGAFGIYQPQPAQQLVFLSDKDDVRPSLGVDPADLSVAQLTTSSGIPIGSTVQEQESPLTSVGSDQEVVAPWYADQIPPFDITMAAASEYGKLAVMRVYGAEILNEAYGISVDDVASEMQSTYVARSIVPWRPVVDPSIADVGRIGAA